MKVLLLSMPDSFEHMPTVAIRMPNGALTSLAGNVDAHHKVAVADLVLVQDRVRETVERLVREVEPDLVGVSVMTFQRRTAARIIKLLRELKPDVKIVAGGYDPSLAPEAYMVDLSDSQMYGGELGMCGDGSVTRPAVWSSTTLPGRGEAPSPHIPSPHKHSDQHVAGVDFIVRGEGEITFRELLRAIERGSGFERIAGLTWRQASPASVGVTLEGTPELALSAAGKSTVRRSGTGQSPVPTHPEPGHPFIRSCDSASSDSAWAVNPDRPVHSLDNDDIHLPDRSARVLKGYTLMGRGVDVIETSRGCTYDCSFCSIIEMRGRNFHTYSFERVLADIRDARDHGARALFIVDDNITLNVRRFEALCQAIIQAGLNDIDYMVRGMTSAIANHGERLAPLMRRAGFRYVFLGIENILADDLAFLKAAAKNAERQDGHTVGNATLKAIDYIHRNKMLVVGGLIVGNPDDTRESIEANLKFAARYVDWPYIQHPTPYPRTPMTRDFVARDLIVNRRLQDYDGTTAVVKTESLEAEDIEFMRWQAERWMKVQHIPAVFRHDPWFVLTHWPGMLAHTFRGSTWKTALGLESQRKAFKRYKNRREQEREYV